MYSCRIKRAYTAVSDHIPLLSELFPSLGNLTQFVLDCFPFPTPLVRCHTRYPLNPGIRNILINFILAHSSHVCAAFGASHIRHLLTCASDKYSCISRAIQMNVNVFGHVPHFSLGGLLLLLLFSVVRSQTHARAPAPPVPRLGPAGEQTAMRSRETYERYPVDLFSGTPSCGLGRSAAGCVQTGP